MNPSIVMATVDRSPKSNYVHASIADLYAKDPTAPPMTLFVGSTAEMFLGPLAQDERVRVVGTTREEGERLDAMSVSRRASWNLTRAITMPSAADGVILLEDDLVFARDWYQRLCSAGSALVSKYGSRNLLSGYRTYQALGPGGLEAGDYARLPGAFYASLCAFLVSDDARQVAAAHVSGQAPFDLALGSCPLGMWSTGHSVVDHVGDESTLGPFAVRRAFDFRL